MVRTPRTPSVTENSEFETAVHWPAVAAGGGLALGLLAALLSVAWLSSGRFRWGICRAHRGRTLSDRADAGVRLLGAFTHRKSETKHTDSD